MANRAPGRPEDWALPEVHDPAISAAPAGEAPYDTGSDAWWRAQGDAGHTEAVRTEAVRTEAVRTEVGRTEVGRTEVGRTEAGRTEAVRTEAGRTEVGRTEAGAVGDEQAQVDPALVDHAPVDPLPVPLPVPVPVPVPEPVAPLDLPTATSPRLGRNQLPAPRSPLRALVGALVAVGGVGLVIVALLVVRSDPSTISPAVIAAAGSATALPAAVAPTALLASPEPASLTPSPLPADAGSLAPAAPEVVPARGVAAPHAQTAPRLPLTVLNNSRESGLADRAATAYRAGGWSVVMVGNYTGQVAVTTVYFATGQEPSARRLARQFSGIVQVLPRIEGLPGSGLTVVLTRDYSV